MSNAAPIPPRWKLVLFAIAGAIGFIALGIWMITSPGSAVTVKFVGGISIILFSYCAAIFTWRVISGRRLYVGDDGFGFGVRNKPPRLVSWSDVEKLSIYRNSRQAFVVVALSNYTAYLSQFSEAEAQAELFKFKFMAGSGQAIAPFATGQNRYQIEKVFVGNRSVRTLADKMALYRSLFGGEILLSMYERDRGPEAFLSYMSDFWERDRTKTP